MSPRSSIGCIQNDFRPYGMFGSNLDPILHQDELYLQTDRLEHPLELHHLGVPSDVSKTISEPMVRSSQTEQLPCAKMSTISK
jgi:hypothetical protein